MEPLTAAQLGPLLDGTIFARRIHDFDYIHSTNTAAMQAAAAGEDEGAVFIAEMQVQGRGRGGHTWHSEAGSGIYLSVILRPKIAPPDALWLSLIMGLAAHQAVSDVAGITPDLRWPNDLMFGEKKFGGILTELNAGASEVRFAVAGIGINVNHEAFPPELAPIATSLRIECARRSQAPQDAAIPRIALTVALLQSLDREYRAIANGPSGATRRDILRRFEACSSYVRGASVRVEEDGGYRGVTDGLDERGFLRVRTTEGVRTVISGGVRKI